MKAFLTTMATAVVSLCGAQLIAIKALGLPFTLQSFWNTTLWMAAEPLLLAASMLTLILIIGRSLDFVRDYHEGRLKEFNPAKPLGA